MKKFEKYINKIHQDFPDFNISSIKEIGEGEDSRAFRINEDYIFRFPKRKEVKKQILREIAVLPKIKSSLNLLIPHFELISPDTNFVGYKMIPGSPFTLDTYQSLTKKQRGYIHQAIGDFLFKLHHINLHTLNHCNLETMDPYEEYSGDFAKAKKYIFPHISKSKQKIITRLFIQYLSNPENFNYTPALIHNDFSKDHILFDTVNKPSRPAGRKITGIIDFGDVAIGDPDYDLMYLMDEFGGNFLKGIFKTYPPKNRNKLLQKLFFLTVANKIQIILANINNIELADLKNDFKELDIWLKKCEAKEIFSKRVHR